MHTIDLPDIALGPDRQLLLCWDKGEHHFEIEVFPGGTIEFFYLNHQTNDVWKYECMLREPIPDEIKEKLRLFAE